MSALRRMTARYAGTCTTCNGTIRPGDEIEHAGRGLTYHAGTCAEQHDPDATPAPSTSSRRRGRRVHTVRTSSGWVGYQNARGRCEDAPCCGCCTY